MFEDLKGQLNIMNEQMGVLTREMYALKKNQVKILEVKKRYKMLESIRR